MVGAVQRKACLEKVVLWNMDSSGTVEERRVRTLTRAVMRRLRYRQVSPCQWRSNRLCRLCSAQGPPAFRGPQLKQKIGVCQNEHRPRYRVQKSSQLFIGVNLLKIVGVGLGPPKNFPMLSFEMLNFYAFWTLVQGDSTATVIKIFMTSAHYLLLLHHYVVKCRLYSVIL